jgi:hypothetical protein
VAARLQAVVEGGGRGVWGRNSSGRGHGRTGSGRATAGTAISSATCKEFGHVRAECPVELKKLAKSMLP